MLAKDVPLRERRRVASLKCRCQQTFAQGVALSTPAAYRRTLLWRAGFSGMSLRQGNIAGVCASSGNTRRWHRQQRDTSDTREASMRYPRDGRQAAQQEDETAHSCRHALSGPPCQVVTAYIDCITSSASTADFERANPGHNLARQDGMTQLAIAGNSGMIPGNAPLTWLLAGRAAGQWRHYHARERGGGLTANDDLRVTRQKYFDASR